LVESKLLQQHGFSCGGGGGGGGVEVERHVARITGKILGEGKTDVKGAGGYSIVLYQEAGRKEAATPLFQVELEKESVRSGGGGHDGR
jgi:hypothetical protein